MFFTVRIVFWYEGLNSVNNQRLLNVPVAKTAVRNSQRDGGLRGNELLWVKLSMAEAATQRLSKQAVGSRGPKPLI